MSAIICVLTYIQTHGTYLKFINLSVTPAMTLIFCMCVSVVFKGILNIVQIIEITVLLGSFAAFNVYWRLNLSGKKSKPYDHPCIY